MSESFSYYSTGYKISKKIFIFFFFCCLSTIIFSQNKSTKDTTAVKDSAQFYKNLQKFADKRKFTQMLFRSTFKETVIETKVPVKTGKKKGIPTNDNFKRYESRTIRNIRIITIDPFGDIQGDTIAIAKSLFEKAGNKLHVTSRQHTIRNQLLFTKGEPLDSIKLMESERLLRQSLYVKEAKIKAQLVSKQSDSVDILVTIRDLWTIDGNADISPGSNTIQLREKNFIGLGHQLNNTMSFNLNSSGTFRSTGSYIVPNIKHTFITGTVFYNTSDVNTGMGISLDRGFFSPLTKWAGGISTSSNHIRWPYTSADKSTQLFPLVNYAQDVWLGRSFNIGKNKPNAYKDPKILVTGRVYNNQYQQRPPFIYDSLKSNQGSTLYLSSVSYSTRSYYKDINIYQFGRIEDVPEGKLIALIGGVQKREFSSTLLYYGLKLSFGKHIEDWGYLAGNLEHGSFFENGMEEKGVMNGRLYFFNDLLKYRKWSMRQFIDLRFTGGIHRAPGESININGSNGLFGFNSSVVSGKNKMVLNLANVLYLPYKIIGFQFATFLFANFGSVADTQSQLFNTKVYQAYGIGLLVRNEFLVVSTFQFSFGYYPNVPGSGTNIFKFNPFETSALKFSDLYFSKPDLVGYY
jgi:hypothetical protein